MAYEIVLKKRFTNKLIKVLIYLEKEWSPEVASAFLQKIDHRLKQYKVKKKKIIVLNMYDTRMNPKKKKY